MTVWRWASVRNARTLKLKQLNGIHPSLIFYFFYSHLCFSYCDVSKCLQWKRLMGTETETCVYYSNSDHDSKLKIRVRCSSVVDRADASESWAAGWEYDHSLLISPLFLKLSLGLCQLSSTYTCAFVQSRVCVCVCVWSLSLPYHPWPLQRVITWSSSTDS